MLKLESIFLLRHRGKEPGMGTTVSLSLSFSVSVSFSLSLFRARSVNRLAAGEEENFGGGEGGWHGTVAFLGFFVRLGFLGLVRNFY